MLTGAPITLAPQQLSAVEEFGWWWDAPASQRRQVFRLFGYAGTGKTTIARRMAEQVGGAVALCAFTGKAASVLARKSERSATTVHRLIYQRVKETKRADIGSLVDLVEACGVEMHADGKVVRSTGGEIPGEFALELSERRDELLEFLRGRDGRARMSAEEREAADLVRKKADKSATRLRWTLRPSDALKAVRMIVLDECSMIGRDLWFDLLSFGRPILAIGDPAQLPPVGGESPLTEGEPDAMLTEIHRQQGDSGIIRLAHEVRAGNAEWVTAAGGLPDVAVKRWPQPQWLLDFDQVLVGSNRTRQRINTQVREMLGHDRYGDTPQPGEKVICLRNRPDDGLMNGQQFTVLSARQSGDVVDLELGEIGAPHIVTRCVASMEPFRTGEADRVTSRTLAQITFAYACTVHKSQGSEWDSVLLIDEGGVFAEQAGRWLYTGITRAARELTICTGGPIATKLSGRPVA